MSETKKMSLLGVVAIGIGSMLGAGIFALLGQVVLQSGQRVYLTFIFAGAVAVLSGYSFSKLAGLYPNSGGITNYFNQAFNNRFFAGLFSFIYLATLCVSIAMLGRSLGIYAQSLFNLSNFHSAITSVAAIILLGLFNVKGASSVGRAEVVLVAFKLGVLIVLIAMASYQYIFIAKPLAIIHTLQPIGFWKGVSFAFFAYAGYGVMTNAAGDVNNPRKTIPIAIFIAISVVLILYMLLAFVVMNYIPVYDLHQNVDTAIAVAAKSIMGKYGFLIMSVAAIIALLSGINALYYSSFKVIDYMSSQKELPAILNKKIIGNGSIGAFLIIFGMAYFAFYFNFQSIAVFASSAFLVSYIAVFVAHLMLFKKTDSSMFLILLGLTGMITIFVQSILN